MYYFLSIIFKYFLTVCTDNPVCLVVSFLATPSTIIRTNPENRGVQKGLQNHPDFVPKTSRFQSLTKGVQKEYRYCWRILFF